MHWKPRKNRRGQYSPGYSWIFALVTLFGLGVMYIVFDQVFVGNLIPVVKNIVNGTSTPGGTQIDLGTQTQINGEIDKYMRFWHAIPFILFITVVIFMIVSAVRKEGDSAWR